MSDVLNVVLKLLELLVMLAFIAHWMACIFYLIGRESSNYYESWIVKNNLQDLPIYDQYISALYWAVTTMFTVGYGDISALTSPERACCMVCMLISCVMYAYIVGSIGSLVKNSSQVADNLREQMINMNRFLARRRIPKELRLKIQRYLQYMIEEKSQIPIDEDTLLEQLNIPLRDELTVYFRGQVLLNCPVFDDFSIDFMSYLTFFMNIESFSAGDTFFEVFFFLIKCKKEDEASTKAYFIIKGKVLIYSKCPLAALSELKEGDYFGEIGFFGHKPRTASADSLSFTQVLTISAEGINKVSTHFPESMVFLNKRK